MLAIAAIVARYDEIHPLRGKRDIVLIREGGSEEDETNLYDIVKLGADSLVYKDADETFEYTRQKPKEEYGTEVQLEDAQNEFFM